MFHQWILEVLHQKRFRETTTFKMTPSVWLFRESSCAKEEMDIYQISSDIVNAPVHRWACALPEEQNSQFCLFLFYQVLSRLVNFLFVSFTVPLCYQILHNVSFFQDPKLKVFSHLMVR